jgi:hypothetical protein
MAARLFTVHVMSGTARRPDMTLQHIYECEFAGKHFSREHEDDLKKWVRVAAKHVYGPETQIIFLHTERYD